jgi:hypothetical protein
MAKRAASERDGTVDVRPGEVVVRAHPRHGLVSFVPTGGGRGYTSRPALVLEPEVDYVVSRRLFNDHRSAASAMLRSGAVEIVTDATRGLLPPTTDLSDTYTRAILRDGKPPEPGRQERVTAMRAVLVSEQLARCVVETLETVGLPTFPPSAVMQDEAAAAIVRDLVSTYEEAFERGIALSEPWVARAAEIRAIHAAKAAGLVDDLEIEGVSVEVTDE